MKTALILIVTGLVSLLCLNCADEVLGGTSGGQRNALLDSTVIYTADSLSVRVSDTGTVNVSNILSYNNTNPSVTQFSVMFTGQVDGNAGYSNKFLGISTNANAAVNYIYRKYNTAINGPHYFTATVPTSNFKLDFYVKHYINSQPNAFIKISNIVVKRLF